MSSIAPRFVILVLCYGIVGSIQQSRIDEHKLERRRSDDYSARCQRPADDSISGRARQIPCNKRLIIRSGKHSRTCVAGQNALIDQRLSAVMIKEMDVGLVFL